jgi:hypothetical protein
VAVVVATAVAAVAQGVIGAAEVAAAAMTRQLPAWQCAPSTSECCVALSAQMACGRSTVATRHHLRHRYTHEQ